MTDVVTNVGPGWNISNEGYSLITDNGNVKNANAILQNALDADLKEVGSPVLANEMTKNRIQELVLQIQKIRNVSAPKANEDSQTAPRMLKLTLTDGHSYGQAIEVNPLSGINHNKTAPGSKVLIKNAKIQSGYIILNNQNCTYLGGKVPALYEKWEISKSMLKKARSNSNADGPPAWVRFGSKIASSDQTFKSLQDKSKETKQNPEFETQRKDAILEAASGAVKKVFGGGLKVSTNLELKEPQRKSNNNRERVGKRNESREKETEGQQLKPVERISLFQFLEEKLPESVAVEEVADFNRKIEQERRIKSAPITNHFNKPQNRYQRNYSSAQNYRRGQNDQNETNYTTRNHENSHYRPKKHENFKQNNPPNKYKNPETENQYGNFNPQSVGDFGEITNGIGKMNLNAQFASRSLRQHLNLNESKGDENIKKFDWKVGDSCLAKYWEDGKFYNAVVTAVTDKTCVVRFRDYGNIEEVLKNDCKELVKKDFRNFQGQNFRPRRPRT